MAKKKLSDDLELEIDSGGVMTMRELREFIKEQKLSPSDLFSKFDLIEDPDGLLKEAIDEKVNFELEYRDQEAQGELKKMDKEKEEIEEKEGKDFDLLPAGDLKKKTDRKNETLDEDEGNLLPPGGGNDETESDSSDDSSEDPLLPS